MFNIITTKIRYERYLNNLYTFHFREKLALNVYVALCYYKLDYYDVSQEVLGLYQNHYPDSLIAINLKACNTFRLYNGTTAENELRTISEQSSNIGFGHDLLKHNMVVFRDGEGAMQVIRFHIFNYKLSLDWLLMSFLMIC